MALCFMSMQCVEAKNGSAGPMGGLSSTGKSFPVVRVVWNRMGKTSSAAEPKAACFWQGPCCGPARGPLGNMTLF